MSQFILYIASNTPVKYDAHISVYQTSRRNGKYSSISFNVQDLSEEVKDAPDLTDWVDFFTFKFLSVVQISAHIRKI